MALRQEQAQLLAAAQQAQHAAAEQEPLRQQVARARATVDVFEGRLSKSTAAMGRKEVGATPALPVGCNHAYPACDP